MCMKLYCIGNWRSEGLTLLKNGIATKEHLFVPECAHTITMEWHLLHRDSYVSIMYCMSLNFDN